MMGRWELAVSNPWSDLGSGLSFSDRANVTREQENQSAYKYKIISTAVCIICVHRRRASSSSSSSSSSLTFLWAD